MSKNAEYFPSEDALEHLADFGALEGQLESLIVPTVLARDRGSIAYSYLESQSSDSKEDPTVVYLPGLSENRISAAPLGISLTKAGFNVVLPDPYEGEMHPGDHRSQRAIATSAEFYSAVIADTHDSANGTHFVTHSVGNLALQRTMLSSIRRHKFGMVLPHEESDTPLSMEKFQDAKVAMIAPAGMSTRDSFLKISLRNNTNMRREKAKTGEEYPDITGEISKSCLDWVKKNIRRTIRETYEMTRREAFEPIIWRLAGIGKVAIIGHANDPLFPHDFLAEGYERLVEAGVDVSYFTGYKASLGHESDTHNDEQANPSRIAPALADFLKSE